MKTSAQMRQMIGNWEGLRLTAYHDAVGVLTIGYGHTGDDVAEGMRITEVAADQLLSQDLERFEAAVTDMAQDATSQQQFDALVSFAFNLGEVALEDSTLLRMHNNGDFGAAATQFLRWVHAGGRTLPGLVRRRAGEQAVYASGMYT